MDDLAAYATGIVLRFGLLPDLDAIRLGPEGIVDGARLSDYAVTRDVGRDELLAQLASIHAPQRQMQHARLLKARRGRPVDCGGCEFEEVRAVCVPVNLEETGASGEVETLWHGHRP